MIEGKIIISRQNDNIITLKGLQTQTTKERLGGLLVMKQLETNQALWITPCNSVHTIAMKYDLDLLYVDKNNQICGLSEHVRPWRMSLCLKAKATIELLAGSISRLNIRKGDSCKWQN